MNLDDIESFISLAKRHGVKELKYESDKVKLAVSLPVAELPNVSLDLLQNLPRNMSASVRSPDEVSGEKSKRDARSALHEIKSPFVGTFYTCPAPGEPSYIKVGDRVQKGQVLCIVEAMKIMNEIDSDVAGEIVEICIDSESLVEYGQVLFLMKLS